MEPNFVLITVAALAGATGIALIFVGTLMAMLVALGNRHYFYAALAVLFFPSALVYCWHHRAVAQYPSRLLFPGFALFLLFLLLMHYELSRLGLDFVEVMSQTRPVH